MLAIGRQLGRYEILGSIGTGGMGEVYRARDQTLNRVVAIKVLPEHFTSDPERLARFQSEAKALAALSHPHILAIFDVGSEGGVHFAVMELLEGESLRNRLAQSPPRWRKACEIGTAIAEGLAAAHAKGVIHRDLKPDNVFLTSDGLVKILDFGLARFDQVALPSAETGPFLADQTETGLVMGTVGYMSPEQIRGRAVDARSDIFALGCVLFEMVAGRRPFARETGADVMAATLHDDVPELDASVPVELQRLIRHCLEKSPDERFQSARDVAFDLRAIATGSTTHRAEHISSGATHRLRWLTGAAAAAVILVAIVVVFQLSRRENVSTVTGLPVGEADASGEVEAIAVLPFVAPANDAMAQELSEGIPDGIIKNLYTLRNLRVRPFSSVLGFKGEVNLSRVRDELRVQAALMGRIVRQADDALLISVEFIDLRDNNLIWAERFSRKVSEAFAVQEEILREIAGQLRLRLSREEQQQLVKHHTENAEAFHQYVKGRQLFNSASSDVDIRRAMAAFQQAVQADANYAMAYVGIAECYYWLSNIYQAPSEVIPHAKAAIEKALRLDDSLGEAHGLLGLFLAVYDWDFPAAELQFRRAVELSPSSPSLRTYFGLCLANMKKSEQARLELRLARELDPSAFFNQVYAAYPLYFSREHDLAIEQLEHLAEINPDHFLPQAFLGLNYEQKGEYEKSIRAFQRAIELGEPAESRAQLAHVYAVSGQEDAARRLLAELMQIAEKRYVSPYNIAVVYLGLGETDQAFEWFERAASDHSEWFASLNVDPRLDPIRSDPRFANLLRRLKLVP